MATRQASLAIALGAFALLITAGASAQSDGAGRSGVFLRFLNAPVAGGDLMDPPHLSLSFGGRARPAIMDTGSTGIVVSASAIPNIDQLPTRGPGTLTYSSSGRVMQGDWVVAPATIAGANGASVTTAPIAILAVRRIECLPNARTCTPNEDPRGVAMLGVGFGRRHDHQAESTPDKNPFLNVPGTGPPPAALRRGYVVTRDGVQVGVADGAAQSGGYVTARLRMDERFGEWGAAPACILLNDLAPAACGTVLPDTGLSGMFLTVPPDQKGMNAVAAGRGRTLAPDSKVTISLATDAAGGGGVSYSFRAGDTSNPLAPSRLLLVGIGERPTFVNTGVHLFNGFDYLFDADNGTVGYRPTARMPK